MSTVTYNDAINPHLTKFVEQINSSECRMMTIKVREIAKIMGGEFVKKTENTIYSNLKGILLKHNILIKRRTLEDGSLSLTMSMVNGSGSSESGSENGSENGNNKNVKNEKCDKIIKREGHYCDKCNGHTDEVYGAYLDGHVAIQNLCEECYVKFRKLERNRRVRSRRFCKNIGIDISSSHGANFVSRMLVYRYLGINMDNMDNMDNIFFNKRDRLPIHTIYGYVDVKCSTRRNNNSKKNPYIWVFTLNENADMIVCICYDFDMLNVERVYIIRLDQIVDDIVSGDVINDERVIDNEGMVNKKIIIYCGDNEDKYNEFRQNEEYVKKWNDIYYDILSEVDDKGDSD